MPIMEFDKNKPVSDEERTLSEIPHLTVKPVNANVKPEYTDAPGIGLAEARQSFEFDSELTQPPAKRTFHISNRLALLLTMGVLAIFCATLVAIYLLSH
jgi:hypothetical protein